jgi:hypothetical protein
MFIFFEALLANIIIAGYGFLTKRIFNLKISSENFSSHFFFGLITLCYLGVLINIFVAIKSIVSFIVIGVGVLLFFLNLKTFFFKTFLFQIIFCCLIVFVLLIKSKVYDDYALYYLPAITKITDSNLILGLSNIHFRFGHNFSLFYGISLFKNNFFSYQWSFLIPALLYSNFIVYIIFNILKKKSSSLILPISICLLFLYSVKFYDFGNHGLDVPSSIYFFLIIFLFLKVFDQNIHKEKVINLLKKILIISLFLITLKISYIPVFIFSLILVVMFWKKIILKVKKNIFVILVPFLIWIVSNLLITSCILYPKKELCLPLPWSSPEKKWISSPEEVFIELSAWSKGWIDSVPNRGADLKFTSREDYINHQKQFLDSNWLFAYSNHFRNHVLKFIITIFFIIAFVNFIFRRQLEIIGNYDRKLLLFFLFYSFFAIIYWISTAPLLRFGFAHLFIFIFSFFLLIFKKTVYSLSAKYIKYFITFCLIIFISRNLDPSRVNNFNDNFFRPYPNIFSKSQIKHLPTYNTVSVDGGVLNITNGRECFDIPSPCTQFSTIQTSKIKIVKRWIFKSIEINRND